MATGYQTLHAQKRLKYVLISPAFVILFLTAVMPILYMLYTSLFRLDPVVFNKKWPFLGLNNYLYLITKDPMFWSSMLRTVEFLVYTIAPSSFPGCFWQRSCIGISRGNAWCKPSSFSLSWLLRSSSR